MHDLILKVYHSLLHEHIGRRLLLPVLCAALKGGVLVFLVSRRVYAIADLRLLRHRHQLPHARRLALHHRLERLPVATLEVQVTLEHVPSLLAHPEVQTAVILPSRYRVLLFDTRVGLVNTIGVKCTGNVPGPLPADPTVGDNRRGALLTVLARDDDSVAAVSVLPRVSAAEAHHVVTSHGERAAAMLHAVARERMLAYLTRQREQLRRVREDPVHAFRRLAANKHVVLHAVFHAHSPVVCVLEVMSHAGLHVELLALPHRAHHKVVLDRGRTVTLAEIHLERVRRRLKLPVQHPLAVAEQFHTCLRVAYRTAHERHRTLRAVNRHRQREERQTRNRRHITRLRVVRYRVHPQDLMTPVARDHLSTHIRLPVDLQLSCLQLLPHNDVVNGQN